ncbi:hypothetical protein TWF281_003601 [Arthrobotrys megalospora]
MSSLKHRLSNELVGTGSENENIEGTGPYKRSRLIQSDQPPPVDQRDFEVAIICALPLEASVLSALFDKQYNDKTYKKAPGDWNAYSLGAIGRHNVVLVHMPRMGKVAAAAAATSLRASFQGIQLALVVGICGGVPLGNRSGNDILLGDVVISKGLVQYDFGRQFPDNKFLQKDTPWDNMPRPCPKISATLAKLETTQERNLLQNSTSEYLEALQLELKEMVSYPGATEDKLFRSTYKHKHHEVLECAICRNDSGKVCDKAITVSCEELGCDERELVPRARQSRPSSPSVHFGSVASGDTVMKSGEDRDYISIRNSVIAFEMEGAGVWENFPSVVIKGVCDYADSHKNKRWQGYAAACAAAVTKSFLESWSTDPPYRPGTPKLEEEGRLKELPHAPGAAFDSRYREGKAFCLPGTRAKLLQDIYEWKARTDNECIFWLNGMAGTGKSTIASTVAQECAGTKCLAGSFFFSRGEGDLGSARRLFTTLAQQLVYSVPGYKRALLKILSENGDVFEKNLAEQWRLLIQTPLSQLTEFSSKNPSPIYVFVIDALDECDSKADAEVIIQLFARAKEIKPAVIKLFITSRPDMAILHNFQSLSLDRKREFILHNVETPIISADIAIFLENELGKIGRQYKFLNGWPGSNNIQLLVDQAAGMFIYAATICRFVKDAKLRAKSRLDSLLVVNNPNTRPSSSYATSKLDELYSEILTTAYTGDYDAVDQAELAREFQQIVGSVVVLFNNLDTSSLAQLIGSEADITNLVIENLGSVLGTYDTGDIRLLHPSFRDFLLTDTRCRDHRFQVDEEQAHKTLTERCLELLNTSLRKNMCNLRFASTHKGEIQADKINSCLPPPVQYACRYWVRHLRKGNSRIEANGLVHMFLQRHTLHWFEALSLLGALSEGITMIEDLFPILGDSKGALHSLVYCAKRFILFHRSIIERYPLEIYWSCLLFSPKQCMIRRLNWCEIPLGIKSVSAIQENWGSCLQVLNGHSNIVSSIAFSPDGKQLASGSHDGTVMLWDTDTGARLAILENASERVLSIAFSRDGKLASGFADSTTKLRDIATGACLTTLKSYLYSEAFSISFSYDSKQLACSSGKRVVLWDTITGAHTTLDGHRDMVESIAFSNNDKRLASSSNDNTIKIWDTIMRVCLITLTDCLSPAWSVAFSWDDKQLASSSDKHIFLWDAITGACFASLESHSGVDFNLLDYALSCDDKLVSLSCDGTITVWDTATKVHLATIQESTYRTSSIVSSHSKLTLASGDNDGRTKLWDLETAMGAPHAAPERHSNNVWSVAFSPDGKQLASCCGDGIIKLWDTAMGACLGTLEGHSGPVWSVAFSPRSSKLLASGSSDTTIMLWDTSTKTCLAILAMHGHSTSVSSITLSGKLLASGSYDTTIKLWDITTRACLNTLRGHSKPIWFVAFSHDGERLASGSSDGIIIIWGVATGSCLLTLKGPQNFVSSIAFSHDDGQLASAFGNGFIKLWDTTTGMCLATIEGHQNRVDCVAFLRGNILVSGSTDGTIKVWDTNTYTETLTSAPSPSANILPSHVQDDRELRPRNVLFIPSAFEISSTCFHDRGIAIGFESGEVFICSFEDSPNLPPWYLRDLV